MPAAGFVLELRGVGQAPRDVDGILELLRRRCWRYADLSGRDFLTLLTDDVDDVLRHQAERVHLLRVHPHPHGVLAGAENGYVAHPRQPGQLVHQVDRGVVAHEQAIEMPVR